LTSGGLGQTDIGNKQAIGGISREFYGRVAKHYSDPAAWRWQKREEYRDSGQTRTDADNGPAWSSTRDTVTWSAARIECIAPVSIAGCWSINQSNAEIGSIQFTQEGTVIGGFSNWTSHSNGHVSGTFIENKLNFTITYPEGVIGYYSATYSDIGSALINGSAKSSTGDAVAWKAARIACLQY
jgi:hypothetical protein